MHNSDYIPLYPSPERFSRNAECIAIVALLELNKPPSNDSIYISTYSLPKSTWFQIGAWRCCFIECDHEMFLTKTQFLPCYIDLAGWCWRGVPHPQHYGRCPPLSPRDWGRPDPALPSWPAAVSWSSWLLTLDTCVAAATIISSLFTHSGQKVFYRRPHSFCVKISQKWRLHHLSFHQDSAQC